MNLIAIALSCIARGWHVFPCKPASKEPLTRRGFLDASTDEAQIRTWWTRWPDANVAIAVKPSGLTVLDTDHGIVDEDSFRAFLVARDLPDTYAVRTGRRPEFGVQLYYSGDGVRSIAWADGEQSGDIRGTSGYVMAAGSIHPDSGEAYEVLWDLPVTPVPEYVRALTPAPKTKAGTPNGPIMDDGGPIAEHRNVHMISLLGKKRSEGADDEQLREYALQV